MLVWTIILLYLLLISSVISLCLHLHLSSDVQSPYAQHAKAG